MGDLKQDAAAVAELGISADGAPMIEIEQYLQAHLDDGVRLLVAHVGDEAHPAGIVLLGGVIKPLRLRKSGVAAERLRSGFSEVLGGFRHLASPRQDGAPFPAPLPPAHRTTKLS